MLRLERRRSGRRSLGRGKKGGGVSGGSCTRFWEGQRYPRYLEFRAVVLRYGARDAI